MQPASVVDLGQPHGKFLRCQWTNVYLDRAYSVPKMAENKKDSNFRFELDPQSGYPKRVGSFADGAAAAAKVQQLLAAKKLSPETAERYMQGIHRDFELQEGVELQIAPYIEPTHIGDPLEYQRFCPELLTRDPSKTVTVEEVLGKRKKPTPKPAMNFYTTEANTDSPSHEEPSTKIRRSLAPFDYVECRGMGNKLMVLLHRKSTLELPNKAVTDLVGEPMTGDYLLLTPSSVLSTRSSTSSSHSSSEGSRPKSSKRTSSKSSGKGEASLPSEGKTPATRSSKKRNASSAGLSEGPAKKSKKN